MTPSDLAGAAVLWSLLLRQPAGLPRTSAGRTGADEHHRAAEPLAARTSHHDL
jgi:hypothetical protein